MYIQNTKITKIHNIGTNNTASKQQKTAVHYPLLTIKFHTEYKQWFEYKCFQYHWLAIRIMTYSSFYGIWNIFIIPFDYKLSTVAIFARLPMCAVVHTSMFSNISDLNMLHLKDSRLNYLSSYVSFSVYLKKMLNPKNNTFTSHINEKVLRLCNLMTVRIKGKYAYYVKQHLTLERSIHGEPKRTGKGRRLFLFHESR